MTQKQKYYHYKRTINNPNATQEIVYDDKIPNNIEHLTEYIGQQTHRSHPNQNVIFKLYIQSHYIFYQLRARTTLLWNFIRKENIYIKKSQTTNINMIAALWIHSLEPKLCNR